ncbi:hypothetical protein M501DRAFT_976389 [Patellaria atrata CBS 101060]|uniref:Microbial-type PARG catalytic domain-containing protein n=1 Tax=Patellaria atrata CBS 101060 TaxID=1346257 RepID=A0A9P4SAJ7_9PEZI|nr:hypothetical protein M501DRAFT_976389 [Patellaria atrata CBS 101060]
MGRTQPSLGLPPASQRKEARTKLARATINRTIPALLVSYPRARRGVEGAELIVDPPAVSRKSAQAGDSGKGDREGNKDGVKDANGGTKIRIACGDTLTVALSFSHSPPTNPRKTPTKNVAILNMASPLSPGGGVLAGASAQEEQLCLRTTLLPSLKDQFYRLPDVGAVWTSDVLVFRDEGGRDMNRREVGWVDVVSAGALRFPDLEEGDGPGDGEVRTEMRYTNPADRETVHAKMRAVLRILSTRGSKQIVLGAWGCGAYRNPVPEVARAWRKVLCGEPRRRGKGREDWGFEEVVFAIGGWRMAGEFARVWGRGLEVEDMRGKKRRGTEEGEGDEIGGNVEVRELEGKIAEMEERVRNVRISRLKGGLEKVLEGMKRQLEDARARDSVYDEDEEDDDD